VTALDYYGLNVSGTSTFIDILLRMCKVLSVKSTDKGRRNRDYNLDPIRSVADEKFTFLRDLHAWLVKWEAMNLKPRRGRLSNETLFALKHIIATFIELVDLICFFIWKFRTFWLANFKLIT